jgi:glycosyltransferase involved in cell wall biosynthesis
VLGGAARALGIPAVATLHLQYKAKDYAHLNGLVCIANWQAQPTRAAGYAGKLTTVWNLLPPAAPVPSATEINQLRSAWGADKNTKVFISVGRLVPQKGMADAVAAFQKLGNLNARLVLVGEGAERAKLQALAANDPRIILAGYRADTWACLHAADVFVSAATFEPFGLAILEALQANLPLVCTKTKGPQEFLADANVHWAEISTPQSLAAAMQNTLNKPRQTYDLSAFAPAAAVDKVLEFYQTLTA